MNHGNLQGFSIVPRNTEQKVYGAGIVTDPRHMPICLTPATGVYFKTAYTASTYINAAGTGAPGEFVTATNSSDALINICNVSGSGFLSHLISCVGNVSNNRQLDIFVTVDGNTQIFYVPNHNAANALVLGTLLEVGNNNAQNAVASSYATIWTPSIGNIGDGGHYANTGVYAYRNSNALLPTAHQCAANSLPRLRFEKSLKIDIWQHGGSYASAGSDYSKVNYLLDK